MPCNSCQQLIFKFEKGCQEGGEKAVESLINCKDCSDEIVNRCHTCHWPIYKKELIYESSFDSSTEGNFWIWIIRSILRADSSQTVIECNWCYQQWQTELKKQKEELEKRDWMLYILFALLILFLFTFFWWDFMEKAFNYPPKTNLIISLIACLILGFFIVKTIEKPKTPRYKDRKYRNKESKKIKLKTTKKNKKPR